MRIGSVLLIIWLIIGAVAAGQRHYFSSSRPSCAKASTVIVTVIAGPLNYVGANPKVSCKS
jgi:membrane protein YdbS with pleckstrin-like domain